MTIEQLTDELKQFIKKHFDSIESIEIILSLKNAKDYSLTIEELNTVLRSNLNSLSYRLKQLLKTGLIIKIIQDGKTKHCINLNDKNIELLSKLNELYTVRKFSVINLIYTGELHNLHKFSDAFNFRGSSDDGDT